MTNINSYAPEQGSAFGGAVVGVLTTVMLILAGFLTFAQFVSI